MDSKGRVSLPARFRETLSGSGDGRLILTTNVDPGGQCLIAYPMPEWEAFQERIAGLPQFEEAVILLKRFHIGGACEVMLDRQGRVLVPPLLREYAGLNSQVVFAGLGRTIEVWDRTRWGDQRHKAQKSLPQINDALARLGL